MNCKFVLHLHGPHARQRTCHQFNSDYFRNIVPHLISAELNNDPAQGLHILKSGTACLCYQVVEDTFGDGTRQTAASCLLNGTVTPATCSWMMIYTNYAICRSDSLKRFSLTHSSLACELPKKKIKGIDPTDT